MPEREPMPTHPKPHLFTSACLCSSDAALQLLDDELWEKEQVPHRQPQTRRGPSFPLSTSNSDANHSIHMQRTALLQTAAAP